MKTILGWMLCLATAGAAAQEDGVPGCVEALARPLPAEAARIGADAAGDCDSVELAAAGDHPAARRCAWAERAQGEENLVFNGSAMLLAIYANGWGVKPDFALARRFACEAGGAYAETEGRLEHLAAMEAGDDKAPFDFCDDITSGYMQGYCADREAQAARVQREAAWAGVLASWPPAQREAWRKVRTAADAFFEARVANEVDASGTGRVAFAVFESEALEQGLLGHVQAFERGELPHGGDADLQQADRRLNAAYAAARTAAAPEEPDASFGPLGTIRPEGIRDAERAWLRYRDAWVAFGALRYPSVAPAAWKHHFTVEREAQLRELNPE
jgi:uncharacterized protein YecT (DUF1311 family)